MPIPHPPPQLWSIETVGERNSGRPVRICADEKLRAGFALRSLKIGATPCATYSLRLNYKCQAGGREYGVSTAISGDLERDFVARSSITDIDAQKTLYSRALHFRYVGRCPAGWPVGDATDQRGRRAVAAFVAGSDQGVYPHP